jgi:transposase
MLEVVYAHCAGLDVHKKTVVVCRMKPGAQGQVQQETKTFGTTTPELLEMVDWLSEWETTHVAMESTGVYWKPIYNLLEGNLEVLLVNAKHVKQVPGRKTDVKDAEWLAELLRMGLLKGSFIPPRPQRELRDLTRYRTKLVQERSREVNRVHKLLEDANIKLASVATDILGKSGRQMLEALVAGQTDATALADLAQRKLRKKIPELERALTGVMRPHHRFLLAQHLTRIDFTDEQIAALNQQIEAQLAGMTSHDLSSGPDADRADCPQAPQTELPSVEPLSGHQALELLDTIPGVNQTIAQVIVAELGLDMSRFPSDKHAAAWAGLAPGNRQSAGKHYATNTREGNKALCTNLTQAAWAAQRAKDTYLSALYRRLVGRRGKKRALVAVAHSILVSAYHMLSRREPYRELGGNYFDEHKKTAVINRLTHRLAKLGYSVHLETLPAAA